MWTVYNPVFLWGKLLPRHPRTQHLEVSRSVKIRLLPVLSFETRLWFVFMRCAYTFIYCKWILFQTMNFCKPMQAYIYISKDMRVVLNSFTWKTLSSPEKNLRQTLANPTFIFSGTCWPRPVRRIWMCDILKFAPGVWSRVTLHSVAAALKDLYVLL